MKAVHSEKRVVLPVDLAIGIVIVLLAVINIITFSTESRWIGHAAASVAGFILIVVAAFTGAVQKGRIPGFHLRNTFWIHKRISIWACVFLVGTFVLGLLTTMEHGETLFESVHGQVGIIVIFLALIQLIPSIIVMKRAPIRIPHRVIGYTLVLAVTFQMVLGIQATGYF